MLKGLDLFSGIGGVSLGLREYVRPIAYCEIDPYCQEVLLSRMADGLLPNNPIWNDITTLQSCDFSEYPEIIYAGFPCQGISCAGHGKGLEDERSGLFFEIVRLANEIEPKFIFLENVPAITSRGGIQVIEAITSMGYDCRWCTISAESVGAPHKRDRWFLLAHSNSQPSEQTYQISKPNQAEEETWLRSARQVRGNVYTSYWQENKSPVFRMDDGIPFELDRAKSLGNSVVPQQVKKAFEVLMGLD